MNELKKDNESIRDENVLQTFHIENLKDKLSKHEDVYFELKYSDDKNKKDKLPGVADTEELISKLTLELDHQFQKIDQ